MPPSLRWSIHHGCLSEVIACRGLYHSKLTPLGARSVRPLNLRSGSSSYNQTATSGHGTADARKSRCTSALGSITIVRRTPAAIKTELHNTSLCSPRASHQQPVRSWWESFELGVYYSPFIFIRSNPHVEIFHNNCYQSQPRAGSD